MYLKHAFRALTITMAVTLLLSSCGGSKEPTPAQPTPTPSSVIASPSPVPQATTAGRTPPTLQVPKYGAYSPELTAKYVAEGFVLPGTAYGQGEVPQYGGVVIFSNRGDLEGADPFKQVGSITNDAMTSSITGDGSLFRSKRTDVSEPEPWLAESATVNEDFTKWTFKIRKDVKWHDGKPFVAQDVKFWLDLGAFPIPGRVKAGGLHSNYGSFKEVEVVDDYTLRLILPLPSPHLLDTLMDTANPITAPRHLVQPLLDAGNINPQMTEFGFVSVGPFKLDKYVKGSSFSVVRNDLYFEKDDQGRVLPYVDGIEWAFIPDRTVAVSALRAGRLDGSSRGTGHHLTPEHVVSVKKTLGDKAWFARLPYLAGGVGYQSLKAPFSEIKLRRALNLYTDRREHAALVHGGYAIENTMMIYPGTYWWNPDSVNWPGMSQANKKQDQAEALRLIKEAGLTGTEVIITTQTFYLQHAEYFSLVAGALGLKPRIEVTDAVAQLETLPFGKYQVYSTFVGTLLPNQLLSGLVTTNSTNSTKHGDTKVDEYHELITGTVDPAERRKVLWEAEYYVAVDKAYTLPFSREEAVIGYRTYLKGVWTPNARVHILDDHRLTWLDKSMRN